MITIRLHINKTGKGSIDLKEWRIPQEFKNKQEGSQIYYENYELLLSLISIALDSKVFCIKEGFYSINLYFHKQSSYIESPTEKMHYTFAQEFFLNNSEQLHPILHFSEYLFDKDRMLHRYSYIMDSSIWNYYVNCSLDKKGKLKSIDKEALYKCISEVLNNINKHVYELYVTKEFVELNSRLVQQSYLKKFGNFGHSQYVSPFVFHSESEVEKMIKKEFVCGVRKTIDEIRERKWRFLLVDDKANKAMAPFKRDDFDGQNKERWDCKLKIIKYWLNWFFSIYSNSETSFIIDSTDGKSSYNPDSNILIEYRETRAEAEEALQTKKYDIILLDYLLIEGNEDDVHYGHEILEDIYTYIESKIIFNEFSYKVTSGYSKEIIFKNILNNTKYEELNKYINNHEEIIKAYQSNNWNSLYSGIDKCLKKERFEIGPRGKFFFMFISAYSSAVYERLLAEGLNQSEKYWHISVGACPTNTPKLFLYNLIKLMEKRLDDLGMNHLSIDGIMDDLDLIFGEDGKERTNASEQYYKIQSYQYYFRSLLKDYDIKVGNKNLFNTNQSVLVTHFLNEHINMGGMLEHMAQLVHLTGFGTIRQWPEMWEEYLYVKVQLESLIKKGNKEQEEKLEKLCRHIENYIKKLKSSAL